MKRTLLTLSTVALGLVHAQTSPKLSEIMELGDVVMIDLSAPNPQSPQDGKAYVSRMELSANVNIDEGMTGNVVLGSYDGDLSAVKVDQAYGALSPSDSKLSFFFGQQYFNYGLLNTRLITYPELMNHVQTWAPGFQAVYKHNDQWGLSLGGFYEEASYIGERSSYGTMLTLDYSSELFNAKASVKGANSYAQTDLASTWTLGPLVLEGEYFQNLGKMADNQSDAGMTLGAELKLGSAFALAGRFESLSQDQFENSKSSYAIGPVWHAPKNIFVALEYNHHNEANGDGELRLQVGHTTKFKLPGFSRSGLESQD